MDAADTPKTDFNSLVFICEHSNNQGGCESAEWDALLTRLHAILSVSLATALLPLNHRSCESLWPGCNLRGSTVAWSSPPCTKLDAGSAA